MSTIYSVLDTKNNEGNHISRRFGYPSISNNQRRVEAIADVHYDQVLSYLKATGKRAGLLVNFGAKSLQCKRIIL